MRFCNCMRCLAAQPRSALTLDAHPKPDVCILPAGAMQLSGKYENVRNLWTTSGQDVSNGDTLGFTLVSINPRAPATLCMQLSGNAVTHKQMTFDFSLFNGAEQRQPDHAQGRQAGARIWILAPAVQNRLKHAIGLADASVTSEDALPDVAAQARLVDAYALGSNLKGEFFMQFGLVNQMSRGVAGSMRAIDYAKDATACTVPTNSEVLLRFTIGDPSVERECTSDEVVQFVCARTNSKVAKEDATLYHNYEKNAGYMHGHRKHGDATRVPLSKFDEKALERSIGDREFWNTYTEKYKERGVIMGLIAAVQPKAKKMVEKTQVLEASLDAQLSKPVEIVAPVPDLVTGQISAGSAVPVHKHRRTKERSNPTTDRPFSLAEESKALESRDVKDSSVAKTGNE